VVRLNTEENHITLENVIKEKEESHRADEESAQIPAGTGTKGATRGKLLALGAWQFFYDAHTGSVPDPFGSPRAVIVSSISLEPFLARGDVQIAKRLSSFVRGLSHLQSLLEYQPIHLVVPHMDSPLATRVREAVRGHAWVKLVELPMRHGLEDFSVIARSLGYKQQDESPVWALNVAGVLAVDRTLTMSKPATVRIISIGGPSVKSPCHLKAIPGYPIKKILSDRLSDGPARIINGGVMKGETMDGWLGLDCECEGLTVVPESADREFLGFMKLGGDRQSYSKCFASSVGAGFAERLTTALRGEQRACIACNHCEEVCPSGLMPQLIHKYLYNDELEEAEWAGTDMCSGCGLCSYVCPSKIELRAEIQAAKNRIEHELHPEEVSE